MALCLLSERPTLAFFLLLGLTRIYCDGRGDVECPAGGSLARSWYRVVGGHLDLEITLEDGELFFSERMEPDLHLGDNTFSSPNGRVTALSDSHVLGLVLHNNRYFGLEPASVPGLICLNSKFRPIQFDSVETSDEFDVESNFRAANVTVDRRRRSGSDVVCTVAVDVDPSYFERWSLACSPDMPQQECDELKLSRVETKVASAVHQASLVFEDAGNFDGQTIQFQLASINILQDVLTTATDSVSILSAYSQWLAQKPSSRAVHYDQVCLNYLLLHKNMGQTVGLAHTASPTFGGICETRKSSGKSLNTGLASSLSDFGQQSWLEFVWTLAHEWGHNAGAKHDCCETYCVTEYPLCSASTPHRCVPSDANGGPYIMYPTTPDQTLKNGRLFSPCSKESIATIVGAIGSCLQPIDPCRFGGPCCVSNQLRSKDTICRQSDPELPCTQHGVCDGTHAHCPLVPKEDGAACDQLSDSREQYAVCHKGECQQINTGFCNDHLPGNPGCSVPNFECIRACRSSNNDCVPYSLNCFGSGSFYNQSAPCIKAPIASPCTVQSSGENGECNSDGECVACTDCEYKSSIVDIVCDWKSSTTACNASCGEAYQSTAYVCYCGSSAADEAMCGGNKPASFVAECNVSPCPDLCDGTSPCPDLCDGSQWDEWSECDSTCLRVRHVVGTSEPACENTDYEACCGVALDVMDQAFSKAIFLLQARKVFNIQDLDLAGYASLLDGHHLLVIRSISTTETDLRNIVSNSLDTLSSQLGYPVRLLASKSMPAMTTSALGTTRPLAVTPTASSSESNVGIIIGCAFGALCVLAICIFTWKRRCRKPPSSHYSKPIISDSTEVQTFASPKADSTHSLWSEPSTALVNSNPVSKTHTQAQHMARQPRPTTRRQAPARPPISPISPRGPAPVKPKRFPFATCLFDFTAQSENEASITAGERVQVLKTEDGEWWRVRTNGRVGYVPKSYLELDGANSSASQDVQTEESRQQESTPTPDDVFAIALFDFEAGDATQLSIHQDEKLQVLVAQDGQEWWFVKNDSGAEGYVPVSYVRNVEGSRPRLDTIKLDDSLLDESSTDPIGVSGIAETSMFSTSSTQSSHYQYRYIALYDYTATSSDEISCLQGDLILSNDLLPEQNGWLYCTLNEVSGFLPSNYLREQRSGSLAFQGPIPGQ